MSIIEAVILGIIEGLTEFLPVSSTGHLILATDLLKIEQTEFVKSFEIAIQLGAILSVIFIYWNYVLKHATILPKLLASFIPTAVVGYFAYPFIKERFLESESIVLVSLFIGGIVLILFEAWSGRKETPSKDLETISYKEAVVIGIFQAISVIPGVSRAAATIIGGLILGFRRSVIVEYSFLLAVPTMLAATILDLKQSAPSFSGEENGILLIGFVTAFLVAWFAVKSFLKFIETKTFTGFGIYRIILSIVMWVLLFQL